MADFLSTYRAQFPQDNRPDEAIIYEFGELASKGGNDLFDKFPDLQEGYRAVQRSLRPSLKQEFVASAGSAIDNMQATGFGALALGADLVGWDGAPSHEGFQALCDGVATKSNIAGEAQRQPRIAKPSRDLGQY